MPSADSNDAACPATHDGRYGEQNVFIANRALMSPRAGAEDSKVGLT